MRDPKRIKRILDLLAAVWEQTPDLRLTQLIMNVLAISGDPYFIEDSKLEDKLKQLLDGTKEKLDDLDWILGTK